MFGWEFPPHISGGLGTACFGLTQALAKENIKILFVVPRAFGDEDMELIDAGKVVLAKTESPLEKKTESIAGIKRDIIQEEPQATTIYVPSAILPYVPTLSFSEESQLTKWNYQFKGHPKNPLVTSSSRALHSSRSSHQLAGGYGPSLMEEVKKYAEIGGEIAKQNDFDVIHAHDWLTYLAGVEAKRISGKPLIVHVHATEYDRAGENPNEQIRSIEQKGLDEADEIIAVSEWTKEILIDRYKISEDKVTVVHNGVMPKSKVPFTKMPSISKQVVTFVGRITHQKGPQYFIEAAQKVLEKFPEAHFIMAGGGDLLPQMIEKVAHLRLSSHFHFTGFLKSDQMDQVWSISQVYVMPSVSEPFGITPLEAIQAGVPVIISNQSGVSEVMPHAIKVDFWDTNALANAISSVLKHKSLSKTLSKQAYQEMKYLGWEKAAKKINQLYHELVA
jgi:glycogen synthase